VGDSRTTRPCARRGKQPASTEWTLARPGDTGATGSSPGQRAGVRWRACRGDMDGNRPVPTGFREDASVRQSMTHAIWRKLGSRSITSTGIREVRAGHSRAAPHRPRARLARRRQVHRARNYGLGDAMPWSNTPVAARGLLKKDRERCGRWPLCAGIEPDGLKPPSPVQRDGPGRGDTDFGRGETANDGPIRGYDEPDERQLGSVRRLFTPSVFRAAVGTAPWLLCDEHSVLAGTVGDRGSVAAGQTSACR